MPTCACRPNLSLHKLCTLQRCQLCMCQRNKLDAYFRHHMYCMCSLFSILCRFLVKGRSSSFSQEVEHGKHAGSMYFQLQYKWRLVHVCVHPRGRGNHERVFMSVCVRVERESEERERELSRPGCCNDTIISG